MSVYEYMSIYMYVCRVVLYYFEQLLQSGGNRVHNYLRGVHFPEISNSFEFPTRWVFGYAHINAYKFCFIFLVSMYVSM